MIGYLSCSIRSPSVDMSVLTRVRWYRGLIRLWIAGTVMWVGVQGPVVWRAYDAVIAAGPLPIEVSRAIRQQCGSAILRELEFPCSELNDVTWYLLNTNARHVITARGDLRHEVIALIWPPIAFLFGAILLGWTLHGFVPTPPRRADEP